MLKTFYVYLFDLITKKKFRLRFLGVSERETNKWETSVRHVRSSRGETSSTYSPNWNICVGSSQYWLTLNDWLQRNAVRCFPPLYPPSSQLILKVILRRAERIIEFFLKFLVTFIGLTFWGTESNVLLVIVLCLSEGRKRWWERKKWRQTVWNIDLLVEWVINALSGPLPGQ